MTKILLLRNTDSETERCSEQDMLLTSLSNGWSGQCNDSCWQSNWDPGVKPKSSLENLKNVCGKDQPTASQTSCRDTPIKKAYKVFMLLLIRCTIKETPIGLSPKTPPKRCMAVRPSRKPLEWRGITLQRIDSAIISALYQPGGNWIQLMISASFLLQGALE